MHLLRLAILAILIPAAVFGENLVCKIQSDSPDDLIRLEALGVAVLQDEIPGLIYGRIDDSRLEELINEGFVILDHFPLSNWNLDDVDPEYHDYDEMVSALEDFAAQYPQLCKLDSIGRAQQFPRTIWCLKVSDNPELDEDELCILYDGVHHAAELMGCETILYMIGHLLENYGTGPEITSWIDNYQIFFIPIVNPDGHHAVLSGINEFWRKNARDLDGDGIFYEFVSDTSFDDHEGIDLNRNYDWYWNNYYDPWHYYYGGEYPASELETQAVINLGIQYNFVCEMSFHSFGEYVMYPWSATSLLCPDLDICENMGNTMAQRFIADNGNRYTPYAATGMLGMTMNWFYGARGAISFLIELNSETAGMIPPGYEVEERAARYYDGAKFLLERMTSGGITGHITDAVTGDPVYAAVDITDRISTVVDQRYSDPVYGRYTRLLLPGDYGVAVGADNYLPALEYCTVTDDTLTILDIQLEPLTSVSQNLPPGKPELVFNCSPNPFNLELSFDFSIPADGVVTLKIYDTLGRELAVIIDGFQQSGTNHASWNAQNLPSGIYFAALSTQNRTDIKKIVMVK